MKDLFFFEWLHFSRNAARPIALGLFCLASIFGLYNGYKSYSERLEQVEKIYEKASETQKEAYDWFDAGEVGPAGRPWVNITEPFWSMWYASHHLAQMPQTSMLFNIGQSEHFGYYKRVSMWTTAYDDDLTAEISNPEFVQLGALDFSFVWIYLMPLLLTVLTFQIKGLESDLGFLPLLSTQQPQIGNWAGRRIMVNGLMLWLILSFFIWIPILSLGLFDQGSGVQKVWGIYSIYLLLWLILVYLVLHFGKGQADQALKMVGIWLLLTVAIPGVVNQYIWIKKPADLMMSMIEAKREGQNTIYDLPEEEVFEKAYNMLPELRESDPAKIDSLRTRDMTNGAYRLVRNDFMTGVTNQIMEGQVLRNEMISSTFWFNPVAGFHNWLNQVTQTGHQANLDFRRRVQRAGEELNRVLILDEWNGRKMDKGSFETYVRMFE